MPVMSPLVSFSHLYFYFSIRFFNVLFLASFPYSSYLHDFYVSVLSPVISSTLHGCWCRDDKLEKRRLAVSQSECNYSTTTQKYFHVILQFGSFRKFVCTFKFWRKPDKNSRHILWRPTRDLDPTSCVTRVSVKIAKHLQQRKYISEKSCT
jgi:hypothetical protein